MKNRMIRLAVVVVVSLAAGSQSRAGMIDLTLQSGTSLSGFGSGTVSIPLTDAITTGVSGVPNGSYPLTGTDLVVNNNATLEITGTAYGTIDGTYGAYTQASDGAGGIIYTTQVTLTNLPAAYSAYAHGTLTIDVANPYTTPTVVRGDLNLATVPEPASLALAATGLTSVFAGFRLARRRSA